MGTSARAEPRPSLRVVAVEWESLPGAERISIRPIDERLYLVLDRVAYVGIGAHAAFIPMFAAAGVSGLALFNVFSVAVWVAARRLNRKHQQAPAFWLLVAEVLLHAVFAVASLGWDSGFQYYLLPLIPFVLFNRGVHLRRAVTVCLVIVAVFIALQLTFDGQQRVLGPALALLFQLGNIIVPVGTLGFLCYHYRSASLSAEGRMERLASRDVLTSLLNRRAMQERLLEEQNRFERQGEPFALVLADIDHFKRINDTYGHDAGDQVLVEISRVLRKGLRQQDLVARWGGEEFLMMLPGTELDGAVRVTERLRQAIQETEIPLLGHAERVTMTFGVVVLHDGMRIEEGVRLADAALYEGKTAGRNRVICRRSTADSR